MGLLREIKLELSYAILALGMLLTLFVIFNYLLLSSLPQSLVNIVDAVGNWIVWFVVVGPVLILVGGWYFGDTVRKRREFRKLINVPSKAHFVRNQDRLGELAWYLGSEYTKVLAERRRHWKIRE